MPKPSSWQQAQEWSPAPGSLVQRSPRGQPAYEVVSTWPLATRAAIISAVGAGWRVDSLHFGCQFHLILEVQAATTANSLSGSFLLSGMAENTWTAVLHWLCSSWGKDSQQCCSFSYKKHSSIKTWDTFHMDSSPLIQLNYLNTNIVSMMKAEVASITWFYCTS